MGSDRLWIFAGENAGQARTKVTGISYKKVENRLKPGGNQFGGYEIANYEERIIKNNVGVHHSRARTMGARRNKCPGSF